MSEPFEDVSFLPEHPAAPVAEHEVLMSFVNDSDAALFRDWWELWGKHLFGTYASAARLDIGRSTVRRMRVPRHEEMSATLKTRAEELKRWYDDE